MTRDQKRSAVQGAIWLIGARGITVAAHFGGIFVLARYFLGREEFGVAALALAVTGFFSAAADGGMGVLVVQRKGIDDRRAARLSENTGFLTMLMVALMAPLLAAALGDPEGFVPLLRASSAALIFAGFASTARARLGRALDFRTLAGIDAAIALCSAAARIGFAMHGYGAWSIVLGDLIAGGLGAAALWWRAPAMTGTPAPARSLMADGARIVGARAADSGFSQADRFLVGRSLGTAALGLYGFAWQHAMVLVQQLTPVTEQVALPIFSRLRGPAQARAYVAMTRVFSLIVIPAAGLLYLLAPWLVEWLYPDRWQAAVPIMRALCVAAAAAGLNSHPGIVWLALGATRLRMRWSVGNLVALVGVVLLGLPYGAVGVAHALAVRSLLATVVAQAITKRLTGVRHGDYARALAPGAVLGGILFLIAG